MHPWFTPGFEPGSSKITSHRRHCATVTPYTHFSCTHTKKVGKNNFFYLFKYVHFSIIENFINQRSKMIATKWKWNEHKYDMKKFQSLNVGALVLWRAFGLTEISQVFWYIVWLILVNWPILMNESAFYFCGRWIFTTTVLHFPKSTSTVGIPDFFRVCTHNYDFLEFFILEIKCMKGNVGFRNNKKNSHTEKIGKNDFFKLIK
jgi:hypothetical protein